MEGRIHEAELEGGTSHITNFFLVCGILGMILGIPVVLSGLLGGRGKKYRVDENKSQT